MWFLPDGINKLLSSQLHCGIFEVNTEIDLYLIKSPFKKFSKARFRGYFSTWAVKENKL